MNRIFLSHSALLAATMIVGVVLAADGTLDDTLGTPIQTEWKECTCKVCVEDYFFHPGQRVKVDGRMATFVEYMENGTEMTVNRWEKKCGFAGKRYRIRVILDKTPCKQTEATDNLNVWMYNLAVQRNIENADNRYKSYIKVDRPTKLSDYKEGIIESDSQFSEPENYTQRLIDLLELQHVLKDKGIPTKLKCRTTLKEGAVVRTHLGECKIIGFAKKREFYGEGTGNITKVCTLQLPINSTVSKSNTDKTIQLCKEQFNKKRIDGWRLTNPFVFGSYTYPGRRNRMYKNMKLEDITKLWKDDVLPAHNRLMATKEREMFTMRDLIKHENFVALRIFGFLKKPKVLNDLIDNLLNDWNME